MRHQRIRDAQRCAKGLLHRLGVRAPAHILIEAFCARLGVEIIEAPLDGATAQLVRVGKRTIIFVSDRVPEGVARRFNIAHEIGHLMLKHPSRNPNELCSRHAAMVSAQTRDCEAKANAFASELLMPAELLSRACEVSPVDLEVLRRIARDYNVRSSRALAASPSLRANVAPPCSRIRGDDGSEAHLLDALLQLAEHLGVSQWQLHRGRRRWKERFHRTRTPERWILSAIVQGACTIGRRANARVGLLGFLPFVAI